MLEAFHMQPPFSGKLLLDSATHSGHGLLS
jgi:hypothetical protein